MKYVKKKTRGERCVFLVLGIGPFVLGWLGIIELYPLLCFFHYKYSIYV